MAASRTFSASADTPGGVGDAAGAVAAAGSGVPDCAHAQGRTEATIALVARIRFLGIGGM
jgi:hypothetical protein